VTEQEAMHHALSLALRGWGRVAPNPLVGCVLLRDGEVVGEGWHAEFGGPHAERAALDQAGAKASGATAVVTLEPCAHQGKQPPCAEALIAAGVARVVVAVADPNPEAGGGGAKLRAAGVVVEFGMLEQEARRLNAPFFHRFANADRPWVALKLATSIEGAVAPSPRQRKQLSGPEAQRWLHWLRAGFDAIGIGGATAIVDDPALTVRGEITPRIPPLRVIFAGKEPLPKDLRLLQGAGPRTIVLGTQGVPAQDLPETLRWLRREGNIGSLLVEGGGRLAEALVGAGLVDRYYWIETSVPLGRGAIPAFAGHPEGRGAPPGTWRETERKYLGPDILHIMDRA
jgi:diaminohydroxyphosphoribosylaminopyrimidine deaminase/5-amino-6-(5-phosphoribosylamino)uracil reductase